MHIQSAAPRVHNFHGRLLPPCDVRMHKSRKSPSRAPLRREGDSPLFSTASRVKLIRGLLGSTKANDHIRPRLRQPNSFSFAVVPEMACRTHPIWLRHLCCLRASISSRMRIYGLASELALFAVVLEAGLVNPLVPVSEPMPKAGTRVP